jgi:protein-disulfide isomerase
MSNDRLVTAGVVVLVLCALVMTSLSVERRVFPRLTKPLATVADWPSYAEHGHRVGPTRADVTIVVFSDYLCPSCKALAPRLAAIQRRHPGRVAVIWRDFPLPVHIGATSAAQAAYCAAEQGKFDAFHERNWPSPDTLGGGQALSLPPGWSTVVDSSQFVACMSSDRPRAWVAADVAAGHSLGVMATPTILVGEAEFAGAPADLENIVARRLR